jgi:hypothetical protein
MQAQIIKAPDLAKPIHERRLFLAGGITNCWNWQEYLTTKLEHLSLSIYNPRRDNFNTANKTESEEQIKWEYKNLRACNQVVFWFSYETLCPITLFELGGRLEAQSALVRGSPYQALIIGCHYDYQRKFDVQYQAGLRGHEVLTSLDDIAEQVIKHNAFYERE